MPLHAPAIVPQPNPRTTLDHSGFPLINQLDLLMGQADT
jgi:hypothetical protein